jgi:hypothetical protein
MGSGWLPVNSYLVSLLAFEGHHEFLVAVAASGSGILLGDRGSRFGDSAVIKA